MDNILTYMTFIPLVGAVVVLALPNNAKLIRWVSAAATVPPLAMAVWLYANFDRAKPGFQFVEEYRWIPGFDIKYIMGVDGVSISMVLLTALLCFLCIFASFNIEKAVKGYFALFLLLDTGMMGVFCALDFFLFYVFWEVMLLPMYFLIGIWGGPRREYAAIKFFIYTQLGSDPGALLHDRAAYLRYAADHGAKRQVRHASDPDLAAERTSVGFSAPGVDRAFHRFRDQDSRLSVSYLAARRSRRGADGDLGDPGRDTFEDGHLRHSAHQFPHAAGGDRGHGLLVFGRARRLEHHLRRALRYGAKGSEKARRLFEREPHGLRHARHGDFYHARHQRRGTSDV
jgi:hypothetical protein